MTAQKTFETRVNQREAKEKDAAADRIRIELITRDDETNTATFAESYTFSRPSDGRLFKILAAIGGKNSAEVAHEINESLQKLLTPVDYRKISLRIDTPKHAPNHLDIETVQKVIEFILTEWTEEEGFPTQSPSDSPSAPSIPGGNSTGRVDSRATIRSNSHSDVF